MRRLSLFFTLGVLLYLTIPAAALAIPLQGTQPAPEVANPQTQDRVSQLEARVGSLEDRYQQAAGFRDTDYILRIQKQYEGYYERAFNTEIIIVSALGIIFTAILTVAGRLSFSMFENRIQDAIGRAADQLERSFEEKLVQKIAELEKATQDHLATTIEEARKETKELVRDVRQRVEFDSHFSQGLTLGHA